MIASPKPTLEYWEDLCTYTTQQLFGRTTLMDGWPSLISLPIMHSAKDRTPNKLQVFCHFLDLVYVELTYADGYHPQYLFDSIVSHFRQRHPTSFFCVPNCPQASPLKFINLLFCVVLLDTARWQAYITQNNSPKNPNLSPFHMYYPKSSKQVDEEYSRRLPRFRKVCHVMRSRGSDVFIGDLG